PNQNYVLAATVTPVTKDCSDTAAVRVNNGLFPDGVTAGDVKAHWKNATTTLAPTVKGCIVAFPINMFDTREGLFNESTTIFGRDTVYGTGTNVKVPWNGVMSMVDIDVANLQTLLEGGFDGKMPTTTPFAIAAGHGLRGKYRDTTNNNALVS